MERSGLKYLLDTAAWINAVTLPQIFPERIRKLLVSPETKGLCSISLLETAILFRLGRLEFEGPLSQLFTAGLSTNLDLLELTPTIAVGTNQFPENFQGDPFDRVIVATASTRKLTLITADPEIRDANACSVEFYPFKPSRFRS